MGGFSLVHSVILILMLAIVGVPVARILSRTGHSRWWCIVAFVPVLNLVGLWTLAYARWPAVERG